MREIFIFALKESRLQANYDLKDCLQCAGLDLGFRATRAVFKLQVDLFLIKILSKLKSGYWFSSM